MEILSEICNEWKVIGDLIGLSPSTMEAIETKRPSDPEECCRAVFIEWMKSNNLNYPATWEALIKVLEDMKISEDIKEALEYTNKSPSN